MFDLKNTTDVSAYSSYVYIAENNISF